jgi:hypothetical protein
MPSDFLAFSEYDFPFQKSNFQGDAHTLGPRAMGQGDRKPSSADPWLLKRDALFFDRHTPPHRLPMPSKSVD